MDILFQETERDEYKVIFTGLMGREAVGGAWLTEYDGKSPQLYGLWLTERGKELTERGAFLDAFCAFLKSLGYRELFLESLDMELEDCPGFQLEDWDNSSWEPKYHFRRIL